MEESMIRRRFYHFTP